MKKCICVFLFGFVIFGFFTFVSFLLFWDWRNRLSFYLGFPIRFYEQFYLSGNGYANHSSSLAYLLLDIIFAWSFGWFLLRLVKKYY